MKTRPATRYAWNGDVALAYQVLGDGPLDLLYLQGFCSHVDLSWESHHLARFLRRLSGASRLIVTDRRGWGCSDRFSVGDVPPFETFSDDLVTVLDAVGSERTAIFATEECTPIAALFAATHPERIAGLILCDSYTTYLETEETPWMWTPSEWEETFRRWREEYPSSTWWEGPEDHSDWDWFRRYVRASVAPGALIAEIRRFFDTDIRPALPVISAPTLVIADPAGTNDRDPRNGRLVANRIPGAKLIELRAPDGSIGWPLWYGRADAILREVTRFLASLREEEIRLHRVLATILFTDIVDSTAQAAAMGDGAWREVRERHDRLVRAQLARYRGREVKTTGDGFLATFDGPARGVRCAQSIVQGAGSIGIEVRAGLHTGEVELEGDDIAGIAVAIGARIAASAAGSEVLASQTVRDLVAGSGLVFEDAGEHELKGVPDRWRLYRVIG